MKHFGYWCISLRKIANNEIHRDMVWYKGFIEDYETPKGWEMTDAENEYET